MGVDFRPRRLSAISWTQPGAPLPRVEAALMAKMNLAAAVAINRIIKRRARDMLAGDLPLRFCPKAAALAHRFLRAAARPGTLPFPSVRNLSKKGVISAEATP
jgi:hypothetical protein